MLLASGCSSTCPGADVSKGRTQLIARLAVAAARGTATYVSMLGMPVENQAVARSPQGMAIAGATPPAKSISRQLRATRIRPDCGRFHSGASETLFCTTAIVADLCCGRWEVPQESDGDGQLDDRPDTRQRD